MNLALSGLIVDVFGAVLLAQGIIFNPDRHIVLVTKPFWGANPFLAAAMIEQKLDATVGLLLLIAGFALQIVGTLGGSVSVENGLLLLGPFGIALISYDTCKASITARRTLKALEQSGSPPPDHLRHSIIEYLRAA